MPLQIHFITEIFGSLLTRIKAFAITVISIDIDIPDNAVDSRINLTIRITTASNSQMRHCSFGEVMVSEVVEIEKTGVTFKNSATLTIKHSLSKLPDHSLMLIKAYKCSDTSYIYEFVWFCEFCACVHMYMNAQRVCVSICDLDIFWMHQYLDICLCK